MRKWFIALTFGCIAVALLNIADKGTVRAATIGFHIAIVTAHILQLREEKAAMLETQRPPS
jgi:hypothetical protein